MLMPHGIVFFSFNWWNFWQKNYHAYYACSYFR